MSSNHNLSRNISETTLIDEINSLLESNKIIIPFNKGNFLCPSLLASVNIVYLDLANYSAIEEYSSQDQIITVQTGIKMKTLQNFLINEGKWLPFTYYDDETSLLDIILSAETGPMEQLLGGLNRHILGLDSVLGTGKLIKSGGKVVKNVSGYDLTRFFIGSYGYFALPIRAHLRLHTRPAENLTFLVQSDDWKKLMDLGKFLKDSSISLTYMEVFNKEAIKNSQLQQKYNLEKQFALAFRIYGDKDTFPVTAQTLNNILINDNFCYLSISEIFEQENILRELAQISWFTDKIPFPKNEKTKILDLAVNHLDLVELLCDSKILCVPLIYRIASNRLRFCLHSSAEQNTLLDHLTHFASNNRMLLPLAYGDDTYIRRVKKLGYDTNNGDQLVKVKMQLKSQFDPHNLFNPFVEL